MNDDRPTTQYVTRTVTFDAGHRVMNERMKCFNLHGHTYKAELTFVFYQMEDIGYAIDFKEIKRIGCQWIDDMLDHGMIVNPHDTEVLEACAHLSSKWWEMTLAGPGMYCNPTAENISKEIFLAMEVLFEDYRELSIDQIDLWETPNCKTTCMRASIGYNERKNWHETRYHEVRAYALEKGKLEYDDRKA